MDFSKLSTSKKIILAGGVVAVLSLFFNWAGWGGYEEFGGFKYRGYLVLIAFIYPVYMVLNNRPINKKTAIISLVLGYPLTFIVDLLFKIEISLPGIEFMIGRTIMEAAIIMSIVGVLREKKQDTAPIEVENN